MNLMVKGNVSYDLVGVHFVHFGVLKICFLHFGLCRYIYNKISVVWILIIVRLEANENSTFTHRAIYLKHGFQLFNYTIHSEF